MPAIYTSFEVEDGDTLDTKIKKLYLGMISCGEQAYTLGAAIAECRKQLAALDKRTADIKQDFFTLREETKAKRWQERSSSLLQK